MMLPRHVLLTVPSCLRTIWCCWCHNCSINPCELCFQFDHHALADADAHAKADRALEVVRELHKRYEAQDQRWHNYSKLIGFICFAGLLLAVLYLQRDAHVLYQVHSTIAASVLPQDITSPSDVLDWLQAFLQVYDGFCWCSKFRDGMISRF